MRRLRVSLSVEDFRFLLGLLPTHKEAALQVTHNCGLSTLRRVDDILSLAARLFEDRNLGLILRVARHIVSLFSAVLLPAGLLDLARLLIAKGQ